MPIDVSQQTRHWRDRSPYPGATSSLLPRNSADKYKAVEPLEPSTCIHSTKRTPSTSRHSGYCLMQTSSQQINSDPFDIFEPSPRPPELEKQKVKEMVSYFLGETDKSPEPAALRKIAFEQPPAPAAANIKRSVSWCVRSSPQYQKAMKERKRLMSSKTYRDPNTRNCVSFESEESSRRNSIAKKKWVQFEDGIRSPRLAPMSQATYAGAPLTIVASEPQDLDSIPPLDLGPSVYAGSVIRSYIERVESQSSGSSRTGSEDNGYDAANQSDFDDDSDTIVGAQIGSDADDHHNSENEVDENEADENEADEDEGQKEDKEENQAEEMVWFREDPCCQCDNCCPVKRMGRPWNRCLNAERIPLSEALRRDNERKLRLGFKVFLGILVVLLLILSANLYLAYWENAVARGKH